MVKVQLDCRGDDLDGCSHEGRFESYLGEKSCGLFGQLRGGGKSWGLYVSSPWGGGKGNARGEWVGRGVW